jgi:SAM-dependent methyltransferase
MTNVVVIAERGAAGFLSPCAYLRLFLPLTKPGVERSLKVRFVPLEAINGCAADVVITHRVALTELSDLEAIHDFCRKNGAKWIFDLDDDLLALSSDHPENNYYQQLKPIILWAAVNADQMWVSTAALADTYRSIATDVVTVPNTLDYRVWRPELSTEPVPEGPVRFVYMGTSTHKVDFEELIAPSFKKLASEFGENVHLDIIGVLNNVAPDDPWSILVPPPTSALAYPAFAAWMRSLQGHAVGLAPLCDTPFNRAKSNIKWLEYSGLGLATIAADLPPYQAGTHPGEDILLVSPTADAFYDAMHSLVRDSEECRRLRQRARDHASELVRHSREMPEPRVALIEGLLATEKAARDPLCVTDFAVNKARLDRSLLARTFLRGDGIEIGALHNPLPVPDGVKVRYVDRLSRGDLYRHYPELEQFDLVEVDIIDNGEALEKIPSKSQDFVIANHFLEHCQDPIATLKNFARVLEAGGIVYMALPDKRFTFDQDRPRTSLEHLIEDHRGGPERSRDQHYREWVTLVEPHFQRRYEGGAVVASRVAELQAQGYSIHFHAWVPEDVSELLRHCIEQERLPFEILFAGEFNDNHEMIYVLRKTGRPDSIPSNRRELGNAVPSTIESIG